MFTETSTTTLKNREPLYDYKNNNIFYFNQLYV